MVKHLVRICLLLCLLVQSRAAHALAEPLEAPGHASGKDVYVITFGPGDHPFSKFGHNAVLVQDQEQRSDRVYNFGTFSAASPTLISDFLQGRLLYWVSVGQWAPTFAAYASNNRSVNAQKLALSPEETRALVERLRQNALPEHRYYKYDYYLDNCSTKVRDVLNDVLAGGLASAKQRPAKLSWREHTSRLTDDSPSLNLGLNLLLAGGVDVPRSRWEEMFLPSVLAEELASARRADGTPLVIEQSFWHRAQRPALAEAPPRHLWLPCVGIALGAGLNLLARAAKRSRSARRAFTLLCALLGTTAGLLGCVFAFFWIATDHYFAHANENLLVFPPWALLLPIAAVRAHFKPQLWVTRLQRITLILALGSALGLMLKALPWFRQDNWIFLGFSLGLWGLLALAVRQAYLPAARRPTRGNIHPTERDSNALTRRPIESDAA